tara:strand:+ start:35246 stop:36628 length:1383 start_codon:yes stop_codon:yes gene_type:complete
MVHHLRKFDRAFTRRAFLKGVGSGLLTTGVLAPLWDTIARAGDVTAAYPDHLLSIDEFTSGKISTGQTIDTQNVEHVKDLLDPIRLSQIRDMGRKLRVVPTTTDIYKLSPWEYIEATLRNRGQARFDAVGNVTIGDGKPWIGGNPFPDPKSAIEVFAGLTLSWGRHDVSFYPVKEYDLDPQGDVAYRYESCWAELAAVGRVSVEPKPYWTGHEDKLRYQSIIFTSPNSIQGTSFLNVWPYDQNEFPDLYGYLPEFKRVRTFPTNQRFEPLIAGSSLYLSDAWGAGDPFLTWGNYKIVHRGPTLAGLSQGWQPDHPNWEHKTHGGPKGETFWDMDVEFVPEAIVIEAEPVRYPRAPISKKQVWFDARTLLPLSMVSFDRRGDMFRSFDGAFSLYQSGDNAVRDGGHPYWSWTMLHAHDIQTNRMTRMEQVQSVAGGHTMSVNDQSVYNRYLTREALLRLGK